MTDTRSIAYFTMEIALEESIPTYAGGLGALAGDTARSAADMRVPSVVVTLLHRKGYFYQRLDSTGWQTEEPVSWVVEDSLTPMSERVRVTIDGREVVLRAWRYDIKGADSFVVPVFLLDADLPENSEWDRTLTNVLYGGDFYYRLCQEIILGIGGVRMLRELGYSDIQRFHMNEGHASLLTLELLAEEKKKAGRDRLSQEDVDAVRRKCIFTTHTPVAAGHDKFSLDVATRVIGLSDDLLEMKHVMCCDGVLNTTYLALNLSHYVNGVAKRHGEVSRQMFAGYKIDAITNGIHAATWASPGFQNLFDKFIPDWRSDNFSLRYALSIPREAIWEAHQRSKKELIQVINRSANAGFNDDHLTFGFARRAAPYKRGALPFADMDRLKAIAGRVGPLQFVYAGKAHPGDDVGKGIIQRIFQAKEALRDHIRIAYLPNYDLALAKVLTSGVDVWLNTPQPTMEASGTSGMKAALNGVPSLSIADGWWVEGCIEGVTGWEIEGKSEDRGEGRSEWVSDANSLYDKLENVVGPMFYQRRDQFIDVMRHSIALNGSFFNTQRMLQEYVFRAYFL